MAQKKLRKSVEMVDLSTAGGARATSKDIVLTCYERKAMRILHEFPELWDYVTVSSNEFGTAVYTFYITVFRTPTMDEIRERWSHAKED